MLSDKLISSISRRVIFPILDVVESRHPKYILFQRIFI
jgi:hypothetical protein